MSIGDRRANFAEKGETLLHRQCLIAARMIESRSLDIFHHEIRTAGWANGCAVKPRDVEMGQSSQHLFFLPKTTDDFCAAAAWFEQFNRHPATERDIFGEIYFTHSSLTQERHDFIITQLFPGI